MTASPHRGIAMLVELRFTQMTLARRDEEVGRRSARTRRPEDRRITQYGALISMPSQFP